MTEATTPASGELSYSRIFEAPRELVFRCMIEPEHLTHFWGPVGVSTPLDGITVDARPGGAFETMMVNDADGSRYPMRAIYVEILEPERLVWTDPDTGVTTTSTFVALGDHRCEIRIRQTNVPDAFRSPEARAGFSSSLDRFASYLASHLATGLATGLATDLATGLATGPNSARSDTGTPHPHREASQ